MAKICGNTVNFLVGSILYVKSSNYTIVSHSILLSNLGGVFIILLSVVRCLPIHKLEIIGTVIVILSAILFVNDQDSTKFNGQTNILFGDLIAASTIPLCAIFYMVNSDLVKINPSFIVFHIECALQVLLYFLYFMITLGPEKFLSFHPEVG